MRETKTGVVVIANPMAGTVALVPSRQAPAEDVIKSTNMLMSFFPTRDVSRVIHLAGVALGRRSRETGHYKAAFPEAHRAVEQAIQDLGAPDPPAPGETGKLVRWLTLHRVSYSMMGKMIGQSQSAAHRLVSGFCGASPAHVACMECASDGELTARDFVPTDEGFSLASGRFASVFMMALVEERTGQLIRNLVPETTITDAARAFQATGVLPE